MAEMQYHVKTLDGSVYKKMHISHLHRYVSAYTTSSEMVERLVKDLEEAIERAKVSREPIVVDQDGEMFFLVEPSGSFSLCLKWKEFEFCEGT